MGSESTENVKGKLIVTTNSINNSNRARRESEQANSINERKLPKAVVHRKPVEDDKFWTKFKKAMFGDIPLKDIPAHLILNVAVPAMKQTFFDMFCNGLGMAFNIDEKGGRRRDRGSSGYDGYYNRRSSRGDDRDDDRDPERPETYRDIWFESRQDAVDVYNEMIDYCEQQGYVTVLEYYAMADFKSPRKDRDNRKGWCKDDLRNPDIYKRGRYFYIDLPRPSNVDDL